MRNKGFTIVELVVVIAVLAILAGITIASYSFWKSDAATSTLQYDLQAAATTMEQERNFKGTFPSSLPSSYKPSQNSTLTVMSATTTDFCISGSSKVKPDLTMRFRKSEGEPRTGGC